MPRVSNKESKNIYFSRREELRLTRDQASELLESIPPERIEKIENERVEPHPEEILIMAQKYKSPELLQLLLFKSMPDWPTVCARGKNTGSFSDCIKDGRLFKYSPR